MVTLAVAESPPSVSSVTSLALPSRRVKLHNTPRVLFVTLAAVPEVDPVHRPHLEGVPGVHVEPVHGVAGVVGAARGAVGDVRPCGETANRQWDRIVLAPAEAGAGPGEGAKRLGCVRERERGGAHLERQVGERRRGDDRAGLESQLPANEIYCVDPVARRVIGEGIVGQKLAWLASLIGFLGCRIPGSWSPGP